MGLYLNGGGLTLSPGISSVSQVVSSKVCSILRGRMAVELTSDSSFCSTSWFECCSVSSCVGILSLVSGIKLLSSGLWPAVWTMGNLGRAGYGASLEGTVRTDTSMLNYALLLSNMFPSGLSHTIPVTSVHYPIKHTLAPRHLFGQYKTVTRPMGMCWYV